MTDEEIMAIEARAMAATPGPWLQPLEDERRAIVASERPTVSLLALDRDCMAIVGSDADAAFIAHARADVPALVAEVWLLRARVEAEEALRRAEKSMHGIPSWTEQGRVAGSFRELGPGGDEVSARVTTDADGRLVLEDPAALGMLRCIDIHNRKTACRATFDGQQERVAHFARRIRERGDSPGTVLIVLINADDPIGRGFANALMPGHNWQPIRDAGQVPYARGLAGRDGIQDALDALDVDAAVKLRRLAAGDHIAVVVIDHETCDVFAAP